MKYDNILAATFICRPNRFIAEIEINGKIEIAHVKNTGRCKELLTPNAKIFVQEFNSPTRKTKFDLISVYKGDRLINIDSQVPNKMFDEYAKQGHFVSDITCLKGEVTYKKSRFDFYMEAQNKQAFIEIKGVTLESDGVCLFPDAPTQRGIKHIKELIDAKQNGFDAYLVFIIQMENVLYFTPNYATHDEFGQMLKQAEKHGVKLLAFTSLVTPDSIEIASCAKILL